MNLFLGGGFSGVSLSPAVDARGPFRIKNHVDNASWTTSGSVEAMFGKTASRVVLWSLVSRKKGQTILDVEHLNKLILILILESGRGTDNRETWEENKGREINGGGGGQCPCREQLH